jgi:UDP-glucose 4-epimerase
MKLLVTGSEGFIGKHLVRQLSKSYEVYQGDINNTTTSIDITDVINSDIHFDAVIHLAALVNVERSTKYPADYFNTNVNGTLNVLENVDYDHFIFASSGSAAGSASPYGLSKRMAEILVEDHCIKNSKKYTIFRFHNVTGTDGFPPRSDSLLAKLIEAEKTGVFSIYGDDYPTLDGTAVRDYTHVNEVCNAIFTAMSTPSNSIEELGHGRSTSVKEMAEAYKTVNNCDFKIEILPKRNGDLPTSVAKNPSRYIRNIYSIQDLVKK